MRDQGEPGHKYLHLHWKICFGSPNNLNNIYVSITLQAKHLYGSKESNVHFFIWQEHRLFTFEFSELEFSCYFRVVYLPSSFYPSLMKNLLLRTYYMSGAWHTKIKDTVPSAVISRQWGRLYSHQVGRISWKLG